jgi:DnaK suppressor protein
MLLERRQDVQRDIDALLVKRRADQMKQREDSVPDAGDMALQDLTGDQQLSVLEVRNRTRQQLDEALQRLDEGTYGICMDCGSPIGEERLKALPFARRCVACQEKAETLEQIEKGKDRETI